VKVTFSVDDHVVALARKKAQALGKSLDELIRDYLRTFADDDSEKSIAEFMGLSGRGNSSGWRFDRDEIHNRK
jgi:Ribbon-helix-helix protein, copG family